MPEDEGAILLEKDRAPQPRDQARPAAQGILAHGDDVEFGDGRFGQRGQHGGGHPGGGTTAVGRASIEDPDRVPGLGQRHRQQAAHEASAQHQHRIAR